MKTLLLFLLFSCLASTFAQQSLLSKQSLWLKLEQSGPIPPPAWDGASAYDEKRELFYVFGGLNGTYPVDFPIATFSVLDVKTLTWTDLSSASMPTPRAEALLWVEKKTGNVYLTGGHGPFRRGLDLTFNTTHKYDVEYGTWSQVTQTFEQQQLTNRSTEAHVVGKKAYAYSGTSSTISSFINKPNAIQTGVIVWDVKNGWQKVTMKGTVPTPRGHHHLGYSEGKNALYTYGGYTKDPLGTSSFSERNYLSDLQEFDLDTNRWTELIPASNSTPGKRDNAKIVYVDKKVLYLVGGSDYTGANFIDLWKFDFKTHLWSRVILSALIDPLTNTQVSPPIPIGSYYFVRSTNDGHEFWMFAGSSSEFGGILENNLWKLVVSDA